MSTTSRAPSTQLNYANDRRSLAIANKRRNLLLIAVLLFLALFLQSEAYLGPHYRTLVIERAIGSDGFRIIRWEIQAFAQKAVDLIERPGAGLTPEQQHDLVIGYFEDVTEATRLEWRIERIFAQPEEQDPNAAAAPYQASLEQLRQSLQARRPAVERILQAQVASVLRDAGLDTRGTVWPPVLFQLTESPDILVLSPRDRIAYLRGDYLEPGLSVDEMEQIEDQVESELGVSALIEGTGGFSAYPTMVLDHSNLSWVVDTIAHEWFHTFLAFRPLGWHYFDNSNTRTINETAASIVGGEVGEAVIARFYPELAPPPRPEEDGDPNTEEPTEELVEEEFNFGLEMRETRLRVDELLKQGKIEEAEAYMEMRRQLFVEQGYAIRKLNQAYFAFHGSYAVGPAAVDPIGGKLRILRERTGSLLAFVQTVSRITSVEELDAALISSA